MKRLILLIGILCLLLTGCASRQPYTCTFVDGNSSTTYTVDPTARTITDGTHTYTYQTHNKQTTITYPNGATYYFTQGGGVSESGGSPDYDPERYASGEVLQKVLTSKPNTSVRFSPALFLITVVILFFSVQAIVSPGSVIELRAWMYRKAEPSEAGIFWTRVVGIVGAFVGLILLILCFGGSV